VVVLHDAAPATWSACERLRRCVRAVAPVPLTWLAVPRRHGAPRDARFEAALDAARSQGDELALHGWTHRDDAGGRPRGPIDYARRRWYTAGEGEFAALSRAAASERLRLGRQWFEASGWPLAGFVAPAWLMSPGTWDALDAAGFEYTCTLSRIVALPSRASLASRSIVYSTRAAWRRALSRGWNAALARAQRTRPLLRFELHPGDAEHAALRRSWMRLLERALREREAVTLREVARSLPLPLAGEGRGRDGGFEPHAASPSSGSGLQAGARTAGEGARNPHPPPSPAGGRRAED
jgi:predicted deacetylase